MKSRWIFRIIFALVIIGVIALGGAAIYRMGFSQGMMANLSLPAGSESPVMPSARQPFSGHMGPRMGFFGFFPMLCFGGLFFLLILFGCGAMARRHAWIHRNPGGHPYPWSHGWGSGKAPCPPQDEQNATGTPETEETVTPKPSD